MMRLRELRMFRTLHRSPGRLDALQICEWAPSERRVKDFEHYQSPGASGGRVVGASFGPDLRGAKVGRFFEFLAQETCDVVVMEGPKDVAWDVAKQRGRAEG